jgi:ABC-2 type transport system permease protein
MMRFGSATLPGLVAHNVRIAWRARARGGLRQRIVVYGLLGAYALGAVALAWNLRDFPIGPSPTGLTLITMVALVLFTFGLSQALSRAEATLYGQGDLDLLLGAPIAPRTVLWAKVLGIAATVLISEGMFLLPPLVPLIILGHPALAGAIVLLLALVMVATCAGLAVMLIIVRLAGPRAARSTAQVMIALFGGAMVLASQAMRFGSGSHGPRNGFAVMFGWARAHHLGQTGWASVIGQAGFGDPLADAGVLIVALAVFVGSGLLFERFFLTAFQQSAHRGRPARRAVRSGMRARFSPSLLRTIMTKELALLRRDPQIMATMLLRLVYLVPLMLVVLREQGAMLPAIAFIGVFVTTQLTGDLAWLVISGEDTPDLMTVAPIARAAVSRAKMLAAVAMATPLLGMVALVLAVRAPLLVLVVVPLGLAGSAAAARIQLALERPMPRKQFGRRNKGASIAANLLVMVTALVLAGISSGLAWWLTSA